MATEQQTIALSDPPPDGPRGKPMTIGAVCKALTSEFPDISISKIRYLEDQKLLAPRRTPGGYRLYNQGDVARLRKKHEGGGEIISGDDVQRLTDILAGKAAGVEDEG